FGGSSTLSFVLPYSAEQAKGTEGKNNKKVKFLPTSGKPAVIEGSSESLATKLGRLSDTWKDFGENINKLVEPRTIAQVDSGQKPGNMATVLNRLDKRLKSLKQIMSGVQDIVGDKEFLGNVRQIAS